MIKLFSAILVLGLLWSNISNADPIEYKDDWNTLDSLKTNSLFYKGSNDKISLSVENKVLILNFNNKNSNIYEFNDDNFDIYITVKDNTPNIYIFNHTTKKLYASNIKNSKVEFKNVKWDFGSLMAIFSDCKKIETTTEVYSEQIKKNYFLTKYKWKDRPKNYKCSYLIFGGRCSLIYNANTSEYGVGDKMVVSDNFSYMGDFDDMNYIANDKNGIACNLYRKISI